MFCRPRPVITQWSECLFRMTTSTPTQYDHGAKHIHEWNWIQHDFIQIIPRCSPIAFGSTNISSPLTITMEKFSILSTPIWTNSEDFSAKNSYGSVDFDCPWLGSHYASPPMLFAASVAVAAHSCFSCSRWADPLSFPNLLHNWFPNQFVFPPLYIQKARYWNASLL